MSSRNSHEDNIWSAVLQRIHKQSNTKPRCRSIAQQLMHEEPEVVNVAFKSEYGEGNGMERMERMNKRNEVAKQLIKTSHKHLAEELEMRAKEAHERELGEWGLELDDIEQAGDVDLYVSVQCSLVVSH